MLSGVLEGCSGTGKSNLSIHSVLTSPLFLSLLLALHHSSLPSLLVHWQHHSPQGRRSWSPLGLDGEAGRPEGLGRRRDSRCGGDWDGVLQMGKVFLPGLLTCCPGPHTPAGPRLPPIGNNDQKVYQRELLEFPRGFPTITPSTDIS